MCVDNKIKICKCNNSTRLCGFVETYNGNCSKTGKICVEKNSCQAGCEYKPDDVCVGGGITVGDFRCQEGIDNNKRDICSSEGLWKYFDDCAVYGMKCNRDARKCIRITSSTKPTIKPTPKPTTTSKSTTTPKPVILPCAFTCVPSKIECLENDGVVKSKVICFGWQLKKGNLNILKKL
ncbi:MAG: hypothetical protein UR39_C0011G0012 [Candidatus Woesebacteria bacterium GW2011_GWA1_33_30]|nr:MAG: hypothetical protein UR39_C0011G0012 [Candidatus Woesebacteria bacterium GW2011_GWA1_33_30]